MTIVGAFFQRHNIALYWQMNKVYRIFVTGNFIYQQRNYFKLKWLFEKYFISPPLLTVILSKCDQSHGKKVATNVHLSPLQPLLTSHSSDFFWSTAIPNSVSMVQQKYVAVNSVKNKICSRITRFELSYNSVEHKTVACLIRQFLIPNQTVPVFK